MQYLLIISHDDLFTPTESLINGIGLWIREMERRKIRVYGNPLRPPCDAVTVRVRENGVNVTNGPFADSNEKMCAYELIECASIEEAIKAASRHPMARAATIEVRPVWGELVGGEKRDAIHRDNQ